jgi:hypothetical protein
LPRREPGKSALIKRDTFFKFFAEAEALKDNIGLLLDPKDQLNLLPYRHRQNFKFFFPTKLMEIVLAGILVVFAAVVSVQYNAFISIKGPVAEKEYLVKSALMERDTFFSFLLKRKP